jgi:tRNA modification GTPase
MLNTLALIEYSIDFTEDDEEVDESIPIRILEQLDKAISEMNLLIKSADEGRIIRDGLNLAIIGKPNVGKSSLLNALLKEKRAIVTDIPGTTRDVIEEFISLDGIPVKIIDTAGIRETEDVVEKIGVERSKKKIDEADLVILVLDSSRSLDKEDEEIISYVKNKKYIVLLNKVDLDSQIKDEELKELSDIVRISAMSGYGIEDLKNKIKDMFFSGEVDTESLIISNSRHKQALFRALENCNIASRKVKANEYLDLISIFVTSAMKALGEITGDELEEDLINKIFSEFCVGK